MTRSMFSAITGLRSHQQWMDVIGNNIANVNTTGFKVSRMRFQDILNQTLRGASSPQDGRAGVNPMQVGLGVTVGAIDTIHTQGALQSTGRHSDLAIEGDGYFMVSDGGRTLYTRDGAFDIGADGQIGNSATGMYVLGWQADQNGIVDTIQPPGAIAIPLGLQLDARPTGELATQGNLAASAEVGDTYEIGVAIVDALGFRHELTLTFEKTAESPPTWSYTYGWDANADPSITAVSGGGTIEFDDQGNVETVTANGDLTVTFGNGAADLTVADGGNFDLLTQLDDENSATTMGDGSVAGSLMSFAISQTGEILGLFSNGTTKTLGQLATATFTNPGGLSKTGQNMFASTADSGDPRIGKPGSNGHGLVASSFLEMSNVDLADQFTNMIMAERGFQANSRVITASDEILQDLVNLKR